MAIFKNTVLVMFAIYAADLGVFCSFTINRTLWWPEGHVFYEFGSNFMDQRDIIYKVMIQIQRKTCIKFIPTSAQYGPDDLVSLLFTWHPNKKGCMNLIGRTVPPDPFKKIVQEVAFTPFCLDPEKGTNVTYLPIMNALGFYYETQRRDRNCYIKIRENFENAYQYDIAWDSDITFPYDYWSILQIRQSYYTIKDIPGHKSIATQVHYPGPPPDGGLSELDVMKLKFVYCRLPHPCEGDKDPSGLWNVRNQCDEEDKYDTKKGCILNQTKTMSPK